MEFLSLSLCESLRVARGVTWGRPIRVAEQTPSTNDLALDAVSSEAKTGIVFVAREQTHGRGRRGSTWQAEPGSCLTFSVMVRFVESREGAAGLSLAVGLAIRDVVASRVPQSLPVTVKWPNDVYVRDHKIAGVLIESRKDRNGQLGVVIGIGLNVSVKNFPSNLPSATSLFLCGAEDLAFESLLIDLLGALEKRTMKYLTRGLVAIVEELRPYDYLHGRRFWLDGETVHGAGLTDDGRLLVRGQGGDVRSMQSGHIEFKPPVPETTQR